MSLKKATTIHMVLFKKQEHNILNCCVSAFFIKKGIGKNRKLLHFLVILILLMVYNNQIKKRQLVNYDGKGNYYEIMVL